MNFFFHSLFFMKLIQKLLKYYYITIIFILFQKTVYLDLSIIASLKSIYWNCSTQTINSYNNAICLLLFLAGYNHVEVAEFLLEMEADVNAQDKGGLIPLHNASSYGVCRK